MSKRVVYVKDDKVYSSKRVVGIQLMFTACFNKSNENCLFCEARRCSERAMKEIILLMKKNRVYDQVMVNRLFSIGDIMVDLFVPDDARSLDVCHRFAYTLEELISAFGN